jgi:hypothetical protein
VFAAGRCSKKSLVQKFVTAAPATRLGNGSSDSQGAALAAVQMREMIRQAGQLTVRGCHRDRLEMLDPEMLFRKTGAKEILLLTT